jgi:hypothetical protein
MYSVGVGTSCLSGGAKGRVHGDKIAFRSLDILAERAFEGDLALEKDGWKEASRRGY